MNKQNIRLNNYCACERKKNSHENCLFSTTKQLECESIWYNSHLIPTKNMTIIVRLSLGSYGTSLKQLYQHGREWNISNVKQNISSKNKAKSKTSNLINDILVCFFFLATLLNYTQLTWYRSPLATEVWVPLNFYRYAFP